MIIKQIKTLKKRIHNAICILTNQPDERLIQLYNDLIDINYDFFIIINDNHFDCTSLQQKYTKFHFIQIKEKDFQSKNIWEKTLYYFCNFKLDVYKYIWFIEDSVLITAPFLIYKIDTKFDHSDIDFLSKEINKKSKKSLSLLSEIPSILHSHLCNTLVYSFRISNKFLNFIHDYLKKYNIFKIEYFFCTLASYYHLNMENSIEFTNNKKWILKDILKGPFSFIYPIRDLNEQIKIRKFYYLNTNIHNKNIEKNQKIKEKHIEIKKSALKIDKKMIQLDSQIHSLFKNKPNLFKKPNFRFHTNKNTNIEDIFKKKKAFVTTVFINESYISGALIWAKSFIGHKTKYPLICCVQDKPFLKNNEILFPGVSNEGIMDLLKYFDLVVGVDLLEVKNYKIPTIPNKPHVKHASNVPSYKNSAFYPTKLQVFGLLEFEQLFYIDSAAYIGKNIDHLFDEFKGNFFHERQYYFMKTGAGGSHFMIQPNIIFYYKLKLFVDNYQKYFDHLFLKGTVDETLLYYCIYPHWDGLIEFKKYLSHKRWSHPERNTPIRHFMKYKPFRPLPINDNTYQYITDEAFNEWNSIGKNIITQYPQLKKYYEHIPSFRKTKLFNTTT